MTNKVRNLKLFSFFVFFFVLACERSFSKRSAENSSVTGLENISFLRSICGSFSTEILQAGTVKGLKKVWLHVFVQAFIYLYLSICIDKIDTWGITL